MLSRIRMLWVGIRDSLWFLPLMLTLAAIALALGITTAESRGVIPARISESWLFSGGAEGARGVLSAIAGGLITVTGVVFSVTIVALQLASSQFTPRLLRDFTADRGNQLVLGVFISTFTYTLLVLRTVETRPEEQAFVPRLGVAIAIVLAIVSIGFLIYFINHSARAIQVSTILDTVARRTLRDIERMFPATVGGPDDELPADPRRSDVAAVHVVAAESGYLQAVDASAMFSLGEEHELVIAMEPPIGRYVLAGRPLASVWPAERVDDDVVQQIRRAFVLGAERTPDQDVEFGIVEISDIAVKALSPGINDPTTCFHCIDHLATILLALGTRRPPAPVRTQAGRIHFVARYLTFDRAVRMGLDPIRHFGSDNPAVIKKLLDTVAELMPLLPEHRREPLRRIAAESLDSARDTLASRLERDQLERMAASLDGEDSGPRTAV